MSEATEPTTETKSEHKHQPGDTIQISSELKKALDVITDSREQAAFAFREAAAWMRREEKNLWQAIHAEHPALKGFNVMYNRTPGTIDIIAKLCDLPDDL